MKVDDSMKVLVFSHENDVDGMGGVILANLAFDEVNYELTHCEELPNLIEDYLKDDSILNYDLVFVTSMWLTDPVLTKIANKKELDGKFFVFDNHRSAIESMLDRYPFTKIKVADEYGKCAGTSLFYEFLLEKNYLEKSQKGIYKFVELTRKYETWEWKTRYQDKEPEDLALFYNSVGSDIYIKLITDKLKADDFHFSLDENDNKVVESKRVEIDAAIQSIMKTERKKKIDGYNVSIFDIDYEYRNILTEFLKDHEYKADYIILVAEGRKTISLRSLNPDVNVRLIAEEYGGTGHDFAAKIPINEKIKKIIESN